MNQVVENKREEIKYGKPVGIKKWFNLFFRLCL